MVAEPLSTAGHPVGPVPMVESWGGRLLRKGWNDADVAKGPDCSERCYVVHYVNPDGPEDVMRAMLRCDPSTHAEAGVRRYIEERTAGTYRCDGLFYDRSAKVVLVDDERRHLTPKDLITLDALVSEAGSFISADHVFRWISDHTNGLTSRSAPAYVTSSIQRLRHALDGRNLTRFVEGRPSHGYRLPPNEEGQTS